MARYERFTFLCNKDERQLIEDLANFMQRTQSDAVRFLVINAARDLIENQTVEENMTLTLTKGQLNQLIKSEMTKQSGALGKLLEFQTGDPGLAARNPQSKLTAQEMNERTRFGEFAMSSKTQSYLDEHGLTLRQLAQVYAHLSRDKWIDLLLGDFEKIATEVPQNGQRQPGV